MLELVLAGGNWGVFCKKNYFLASLLGNLTANLGINFQRTGKMSKFEKSKILKLTAL